MKLTPMAKAFIALIILGVVSYTGWYYFQDNVKEWAEIPGDKPSRDPAKPGEKQPDGYALSGTDFDKLKDAPADPGKGSTAGMTGAELKGGRLSRPLVVAINTWAGHAPGIVANGGLDVGAAGSLYKSKYNLDVKFVLLEDPSAKLAAFRNGDVDVMWDTVDSWAREASMLAEADQKAKAILMQDWSRGGDGIASLASIKSVEDLKGKRIATTQFTPSHFLMLYLLNQSGLSPDDKAGIEKKIVFTQDAPAAAAMFKAKEVDAAVTWEPDLSGAVTARGDEAHVLVSTTAASNIIADVLVARQQTIDEGPETLRDFVHGWFDGIDSMKADPASGNALVGRALKLDDETVSGMLSGLKLTPFADNAQFFGLTGSRAHFESLFNTAFVIWRKKGIVTKAVDAKDYVDTRFVAAQASFYADQKVEEPKVVAKPVKSTDKSVKPQQRAIINKQLSIHFTPGSDEIMAGSFFTLDSLGETMISFGNTVLRIEGNTDSTGSAPKNVKLSEKRALAVRDYLVENFKLPAERFQAIGQGSANPIADNATEAGRQLNRRTDIKVVLAE